MKLSKTTTTTSYDYSSAFQAGKEYIWQMLCKCVNDDDISAMMFPNSEDNLNYMINNYEMETFEVKLQACEKLIASRTYIDCLKPGMQFSLVLGAVQRYMLIKLDNRHNKAIAVNVSIDADPLVFEEFSLDTAVYELDECECTRKCNATSESCTASKPINSHSTITPLEVHEPI